MEMTFSSRHGDVSEALEAYVRAEVQGLSKYFDRLVEADIILDREGHRSIAEVRIRSSADTHFASSEAGDMRTAADATIDKLRRQLKRHKEKLSRRKLSRVERDRVLASGANRVRDTIEETDDVPNGWDRISSAQAIGRLEASGEEVLVFLDTLDDTVKIARRDGEGSVSVVEADTFEVEEH